MKYIYILFFVFCSCNFKESKLTNADYFEIEEKTYEKINISSEIFKTDEKLNLSDLIYDISIIPLETRDDIVLGNVDNIFFESNNYIIHDKRNQQLFRFDENGKFLNKIGNIGKGPHELLNFANVALNEKEGFISILDTQQKKISKYNFSGEYIDSKTVSYSVHQHEYQNNNLIFGILGVIKNEDFPSIKNHTLLSTDNDLNIVKKGFENHQKFNGFENDNQLRKINDKVYFNKPFSNTIWEVDGDLLIKTIEFDIEEKGLEKNFWNNEITIDEFSKLYSVSTTFPGLYVITDNNIFFMLVKESDVLMCVYNKKSKALKYGRGFELKYDEKNPLSMFCMLDIPIASNGNNSLITVCDPDDFKLLLEKNKKEIGNTKINGLEIIKKLKSTNNPVIIKYKLKDF